MNTAGWRTVFLTGFLAGLSLLFSCERFEPSSELVLRTDSVEELPEGGFRVTGRIINIGDQDVNQHGFCWSGSSTPTINDHVSNLGRRASEGIFSTTIADFALEQQYFICAYGSTSTGTCYGKVLNFTTPPPDPPEVITKLVYDITRVSASIEGEVTGDGGAEVVERGICWNVEPATDISHNRIAAGNGTGTFQCALEGLDCNLTYYARAYAINRSGAGYGEETSFTTAACLPVVITIPADSTSPSSASSGGEVVSDGGLPVLEKGVCWSTSPGPTIEGIRSVEGSGTGIFSSSIDSLHCSTTYYYRAYATTEAGTGYGDELEFTTSDCVPQAGEFIISDRDGIYIMQHTGELAVFNDNAEWEVEVYDGSVFLQMGRNVHIHELNGTPIRSVTIDNLITYPFRFTVLPGENFAFFNNGDDKVSFTNSSGTFLREVLLTDLGPGANLQEMDGVVVDNDLIISEDGESRIISIDLGNYERSVFRDFSHLPGWLGDIDYSEGTFYMCQSMELYSFRENQDERLVCRLPEGSNSGIAVHGDFGYIISNFGNKVYRVNLRNGDYVVLTNLLNYPQDIELITYP